MSNKIYINLLIFIILVIIPYSIEYNENHNQLFNVIDANIILLLHHVASVYLIFGSILFGYYKIHLIISLITIGIWIKGKFNCIITKTYNKLININPNEPFKDISYYLSKYTKIKYINVYLTIAAIFYDVDNIFKSIAIKHGKIN